MFIPIQRYPLVLDILMRAFTIHRGAPLSESRSKCVTHNSELLPLAIIGTEYDAEVQAQGIRVETFTSYSEVLRLLLLSREPDLLYLDTDCWLIEPPSFTGLGRSRVSNWAMYSGNNPAIFAAMLATHKARGQVYEAIDQRALTIAGAQVINAIHKWEIPWFKE